MDDKIKYKINPLVCKGLSNAIYIEILLSMSPSGLKMSPPHQQKEKECPGHGKVMHPVFRVE